MEKSTLKDIDATSLGRPYEPPTIVATFSIDELRREAAAASS
jgi:hypothetical protein